MVNTAFASLLVSDTHPALILWYANEVFAIFAPYLLLVFFFFTNLRHTCKEQISANPLFRPVGFCISSIGDRTIHIINPLSPNSGQDQFSPSNIHTLSRDTF